MSKTHDYTTPAWGHDYVIWDIIDGGNTLKMSGWGFGLRKGHFLLLRNGNDSTRYQIAEIEYLDDPRDMWRITATFAPRTETPPKPKP